MRLDEIKDLPVVSIAEGTKLGAVHDLLLDDSYVQIAALVIGGGGLLGGQRRAVAYGAVRGIGRDAVMVSGHDAVHEVTDSGALGVTHRLGELRQEVMSESGVRLGQVSDLEFDPQTGALTALRVALDGLTTSDGMAAAVISRAQIVQLTAKMAVVQHAVLEPNADEVAASRAPTFGQVVGQEPADTPISTGDGPAAEDSRQESDRPAAHANVRRVDEPVVAGRTGQGQPAPATDRAARN